ncbi:uncharacterized protein KD926_006500 [Aspergillus affinis]|uniref:uncharacterized protein n=1 Tax=Aspergillus affinis TaxID=1070780 RepID=UPI0022FDBB44|nr:uncharacterized protein KD926_006500 [Aspergillus affinis]KAI9041776.1 hypothetical protein KD926_006500 [Aspergillus affinis]
MKDKEETSLLNDLARTAGDYMRYKDINPKEFLEPTLVDEGHLNLTTVTITPYSMVYSPQSAVAYFFFKEGEGGKTDGARALCALLHQIFTISSTSSAIRHALPAHKANGETLTMKPSELWQILVDCATASEGSEIICVLDALDECEKSSRTWIPKTLGKFYSNEEKRSTSKLKFLITSRPYQDVEGSFEGFPKNAAYMRLDGDEKSDQIREEIDLVIDAEVEILTRKFNDQSSAAEKIKTRLKSMEHRTYPWQYLTLGYIEEQPAMYSKISSVEKLLRNADEPAKKFLLHLVLAAERPLTLLEANIALTLALQEQKVGSHADVMDGIWSLSAFEAVVKEPCGLFISIHDSKLSFIHPTAREFLLTKRGDMGWGGSFNLQQSHRVMLQVCLDYLFIPDIDGPGYTLTTILSDDKPDAFLDYSAKYWPLHMVKHGLDLSDNNLNRVRMHCEHASVR